MRLQLPSHRSSQRGVTLIELVIVILVSSIIISGIVFLLVAVAQTNTDMMRDVSRMNDTDIAVTLLQTYGRDADSVVINSATDVTFTKNGDGDYRLYLSGTTLLGITPVSGGTPFTVMDNVSGVTFTQPSTGLIRMVVVMTWPDGATATRDATVYCRNAA